MSQPAPRQPLILAVSLLTILGICYTLTGNNFWKAIFLAAAALFFCFFVLQPLIDFFQSHSFSRLVIPIVFCLGIITPFVLSEIVDSESESGVLAEFLPCYSLDESEAALQEVHIGDDSKEELNIPGQPEEWKKRRGKCYEVDFIISDDVKDISISFQQYGVENVEASLNGQSLGYIPKNFTDKNNQQDKGNDWETHVQEDFFAGKEDEYIKEGKNILRFDSRATHDEPGDIDDLQIRNVVIKRN